ncbi:MAG: hypothetical protein AAF675_10085 [Pseudomonadota bacterium]
MGFTILITIGLILAAAAIGLLIRVIRTAGRLSKEEEPDTAAFKRLVIENGIALALAFLGLACLVAAGILG